MTHDITLPPRNIEELLFHMQAAARAAGTAWARDFANSIATQSRRRAWNPTEKQLGIMRRMVSEMFTACRDEEDDMHLIEGDEVAQIEKV